MVEIAICLAIIGIALVAIIGVLPLGINVQKDNRQETLIDQDATVFLENIRNGTRGLDDLTNYVYAIANTTTGQGYTNGLAGLVGFNPAVVFPGVNNWIPFLTNGMNIIGLLSTPEYTTNVGTVAVPIPSLVFGGTSNHIVACVRSLSGPAAEQPPQDNSIILGDAFGYKIICNNAPVAVDTNLFYQYPPWQAQAYTAPAMVSDIVNGQMTFWQATNDTFATDIPGQSLVWMPAPVYNLELTANLHELRLSFLWPLLPTGNTGNGRHTFATTVAGRLEQTNINVSTTPWLYFFQPQSFTSAP